MGKCEKTPAAHLNLANLGKAPTGRAMDGPLAEKIGPVWTPACIASRGPILTVIGCIALSQASNLHRGANHPIR